MRLFIFFLFTSLTLATWSFEEQQRSIGIMERSTC